MDTIRVENLRFSGKHGVGQKERNVEQEFDVSAELTADTSKASRSDDLSDTIDYSRVRAVIKETIEGAPRYLIEKLASDIALKILEDIRVRKVSVTVKKTNVWGNGTPSVTVTREA